jgi:hypothetical protein
MRDSEFYLALARQHSDAAMEASLNGAQEVAARERVPAERYRKLAEAASDDR